MEAPTEPTVMLVYTYPRRTAHSTIGTERSFFAFDERGEVIETVATDDREPDWSEGGICDHRGLGGEDGFKALHDALSAAERNAKATGLDITRIPA